MELKGKGFRYTRVKLCDNVKVNRLGKYQLTKVCITTHTIDGVEMKCKNVAYCRNLVKRLNREVIEIESKKTTKKTDEQLTKESYKAMADWYNLVNSVAYDKGKNYPESPEHKKIEKPDPTEYLSSMGMSFVFERKIKQPRRVETLKLNTGYVRLGRKGSRRKPQKISQQLLDAIKAGNIPTITMTDKERILKKIEEAGVIPTMKVKLE